MVSLMFLMREGSGIERQGLFRFQIASLLMLEDRDYLRRPALPAGQHEPSLVLMLVLVNVGAFVLRKLFSADSVLPAGAISVEALRQGEWWTVFTHGFIHADWMHLLPNLVLFVLAGRRVLADTGPRHFLYIYLVSGWVAAAATLMLHPEMPLIGASACVAGVFGAYAALHPDRSVTAPLGAWAPRLKARNLFLGILAGAIGLEIFTTLTSPAWDVPFISNVGHAAHAAGLLTGWIYARHLAPVLQNLYHREDFFPQGLRRRHRETESPPTPARSAAGRRAGSSLPGSVFTGDTPPSLSNDEFLRQAVDPVLDKLYATGMASLTEAERHILDEAATRFSRRES